MALTVVKWDSNIEGRTFFFFLVRKEEHLIVGSILFIDKVLVCVHLVSWIFKNISTSQGKKMYF